MPASKGESVALSRERIKTRLADVEHVWTTEQPLELVASGPWGLTYINPADDPRQKK